MKVILTERQYKIYFDFKEKSITEGLKKSNLTDQERYNYVATKIIDFMDFYKLNTIPRYRFLTNMETKSNLGFNMKTLLGKFMNRGEFDGYVKKMIKQRRPEFSYSTDIKLGANNYIVDDGVAVKSMGEVILYNTFLMNDEKLKYEDTSKTFYFINNFNGVKQIVEKKPDFYSEKRDLLIEVAGLTDIKSFGMDYTKRLKNSQKEFSKTGSEMIILDYYTYKDNPKGFYKYVCEKFKFPYNPNNFWLSIAYEGMDAEEFIKNAHELIHKPNKTRGEQDRLRKIVTRYLYKFKTYSDGVERPIGYKDVKQYKRETGIGLKFGDEKIRKMTQNAWCKSTGSNMGTYLKFKELFGDKHTLGKSNIEIMKKRYPEDFDMNKRDEICQNMKNDEKN
jgi:hypothetical protein